MGFFVKVMLLHLVERDITTIFIFPSVWVVHVVFEQFRLGEDAVFRCFLL